MASIFLTRQWSFLESTKDSLHEIVRTCFLTFLMIFRVYFSEVTEKSFSVVSILSDEKTDEILAVCTRKMVCVDFETHKSAPIPEEKKKLLMQEVLTNSTDMKLYKFDFPNIEVFKLIPPNSFSCRLVVKNTEMDEFNHVTQTSTWNMQMNVQHRLQLQASIQNSKVTSTSTLSKHVSAYMLERLLLVMKSPFILGRIWWIHICCIFSISKGMKERICLAQIEYFDTSMYSHL